MFSPWVFSLAREDFEVPNYACLSILGNILHLLPALQHVLRLPVKRQCWLTIVFIRLACREVHGTFSWLMVVIWESIWLWLVFLLGMWSWVVWKTRWSGPQEQVSSFPHGSAPAFAWVPTPTSLSDGPWVGYVNQVNPFQPQLLMSVFYYGNGETDWDTTLSSLYYQKLKLDWLPQGMAGLPP